MAFHSSLNPSVSNTHQQKPQFSLLINSKNPNLFPKFVDLEWRRHRHLEAE